MNGFVEYLESIDHDSQVVVISKGEVLYHGTVESFDTRTPRVGGYDEVFWTAEDPIIARSYIPNKSGYSCETVNGMLQNQELLKKSFDIEDRVIQATWAKESHGYKKIESLNKEMEEYRKKWKELEKNIDYEDPSVDEFLQRWIEIENSKRQAEKEWRTHDSILSAYVIKKLNSLGYRVNDTFQCVKGIVRNSDGRILPANTKSVGKLLRVTCNRDFTVYNFARGRDGDLMNVEYKQIDSFRKIEDKGFDGIIINDFAQTDYHGNYGHRSVGFFRHSLNDLSIKQIRNQTHPSEEEWKSS